jgi:TRAP-type uncharacterized transport system fused permease subunit
VYLAEFSHVRCRSLLRGYHGQRLRAGEVLSSNWETGLSIVELLMIAAAGFVIGVLNLAGLGFALTLYLVGLAGNSTVLLLIIAVLNCIVLRMGMPTSAVYVLLATLANSPP